MAGRGALMITAADNVATALDEIAAGDQVQVRLGKETRPIKALEKIPFGFKVAVADIPKGAPVVKYGEPIGKASIAIRAGELVHIHNLEGARGRGDLAKGAE